MNESILLTGVTGFLGSALALEALRARPELRLFCLVRGNAIESRAKRALAKAARAYDPTADVEALCRRLVAINGDLSRPGLGLTLGDIKMLSAARPAIWHCAASLADTVRDWPTLVSTNIGGTQRMLDVAFAIRARAFNHVSTAYVCGQRHGAIHEVGIQDAPFNNHYELSKAMAELEVASRCVARRIRYRIVRPSIVVPHSRLGTATGANGALGWIVKLASLKQQSPGLEHSTVRYQGNPNGTLNVIPVDSVAADCIEIDGAGEASANRVFHLTNRVPPTMSWFATTSAAELGVELEICPQDTKLDPLSKRFASLTRFERPYVTGPDRRFLRDDSETTYASTKRGVCPLNKAWMRRVIADALRVQDSYQAKRAAS